MDKNRRLVVAVIASSALALMIGLVSNIAANFLIPTFANKPLLIWIALLTTFLLSLPVAIYLSLRQPSTAYPKPVSSLPSPPYARFYGRDALLDELMTVLREPNTKPVIGIDGLGGIGKTAVARQLVERSLGERLFDTVIWEPQAVGMVSPSAASLTWESFLSAAGRQLGSPDIQRLPLTERTDALAKLLRTTKTLIVLDNLETAGTAQVQFAQRLSPLLLPAGKAILTSRLRFTSDVYAAHLGGLDAESSLLLIRHEASSKGIARVASASTGDLHRIARTTGGSPLAIKLIMGQLQYLPLDSVLASLETVHLDEAESSNDEYITFYKSIFWRSWSVLSKDAQQMLVSMSIFSPGLGGTLDAVIAVSGLNANQVPKRIDELWRASLVEVYSFSLDQIRYYLHPLTQYFVTSDIIKEE